MTQQSETTSAVRSFAVDPAEFINALWRRKWLILLGTLGVGAAVAAGTVRQAKIYQAKAQILIEPVVQKVLGDGMAMDDIGDQARQERAFNNTQYKTITSRKVLEDVVRRLKLHEDPSFKQTAGISTDDPQAAIVAAVGVLSRVISVEPEGRSRVVSLLVEDADPARAARIGNALGNAYIDYTLESRLENTRRASRWLDKQVADFATRIEKQEAALAKYRKTNLLVSVSLEDRQNMISASLSMLNERLLQNRAMLIEKRAQRQVIDEVLASDRPNPDAVALIQDNPVIQELKSSLVTLDKQRAELSTRYGDKHPDMVAVVKQLEETRIALLTEIENVLRALDSEIRALETARNGLEQAVGEEKQKALDLNTMGLEYSKLTRDLGTMKATYEALLKRQTEADLSTLLEANFVRWFEQARVPKLAVRPSVPKNAALGLLAGLLLGVLIVAGGVLLDNTVHGQADVETILRMPFLGIFPRVADNLPRRGRKKKERLFSRERDLFVLKNPKSAAAECARSVRTNLMFMATTRPLRRLLLTSARPAEGKTTTAVALSVAMAQAGNRVLLLDSDLRKPRLHRAFGVSGEEGLTSVFVGRDIDEVIKRTEMPGLDILPCGPLPPNPAELLHSEKFIAVLDMLSERYDRVLLDSPPVGAVTDASILSQLVDGTVLVVQAHETPKEAARRAGQQLRDVGAHIAGVILNDYDVQVGDYGYQHYYYYRGYGYGSDADEEAKA